MRVCLVNSFYPPYIGGAETYVSNLGRNLERMGHKITVYCADTPLRSGESADHGINVRRMSTMLTFYGTPLARFSGSFLAEEFDVIHCNFPNPYFATVSAIVSKAKRTPAVLTWHNDLPAMSSAASILVSLHERISPYYLSTYKKIIATTRTYAERSKTLRRFSNRVSVIPNGVDTSRFNPNLRADEIKDRYDLWGSKVAIFVGALTTWHTYKGLDVLIDAFALARKKCKRMKLMVVGGGNLLNSYLRLARSTVEEGTVIFTGRVGDDQLPSYYAAADFAVLPSKDSSEGFGLVLLEAMACGKAVIGSEAGGIPDVVRNGENGILVPPGRPDALAQALCELYQDDERRTRMGMAGRKFAELRDWGVVAAQVDHLYGELQ